MSHDLLPIFTRAGRHAARRPVAPDEAIPAIVSHAVTHSHSEAGGMLLALRMLAQQTLAYQTSLFDLNSLYGGSRDPVTGAGPSKEQVLRERAAAWTSTADSLSLIAETPEVLRARETKDLLDAEQERLNREPIDLPEAGESAA